MFLRVYSNEISDSEGTSRSHTDIQEWITISRSEVHARAGWSTTVRSTYDTNRITILRKTFLRSFIPTEILSPESNHSCVRRVNTSGRSEHREGTRSHRWGNRDQVLGRTRHRRNYDEWHDRVLKLQKPSALFHWVPRRSYCNEVNTMCLSESCSSCHHSRDIWMEHIGRWHDRSDISSRTTIDDPGTYWKDSADARCHSDDRQSHNLSVRNRDRRHELRRKTKGNSSRERLVWTSNRPKYARCAAVWRIVSMRIITPMILWISMWWSSGRIRLPPFDLSQVMCFLSIRTRIKAQLKFNIPPRILSLISDRRIDRSVSPFTRAMTTRKCALCCPT